LPTVSSVSGGCGAAAEAPQTNSVMTVHIRLLAVGTVRLPAVRRTPKSYSRFPRRTVQWTTGFKDTVGESSVPGGFQVWDGRSATKANQEPPCRAQERNREVRGFPSQSEGATPEIREPSYGQARNALRRRVCGCILLVRKYILNIQEAEGYGHGR
jgi:hypothetical protein